MHVERVTLLALALKFTEEQIVSSRTLAASATSSCFVVCVFLTLQGCAANSWDPSQTNSRSSRMFTFTEYAIPSRLLCALVAALEVATAAEVAVTVAARRWR